MTFADLPPNLRQLSLRDPVLAADVVDLCCLEDARQRGALVALICDADGRMLQPVLLDEIPWGAAAPERMLTFEVLLEAAAEFDGTLVIAFARIGGQITDTDRRWHQSAIEACGSDGSLLLGTYIASPSRVIRLPDPDLVGAAV